MRALCVASVMTVLLLAGCGGGKPGTSPATKTAPEKAHLALLGIHALELGASLDDCKQAFPPPKSAKAFHPDVQPGLPYTGWVDDNSENFGAAFKKDGGVVQAVHRLRIDGMKEAQETLDLYAQWFGKGKRTEKPDYVEVVYERGNERLTLRAIEKKGNFCTFNEILQDTSFKLAYGNRPASSDGPAARTK